MEKQLVTNELLPIYQTTDTGEKVVDGRELHGFLNVGRDFSSWLKDRVEKYSFTEGEDFSPVSGKSSGGRPATDYILKLDMAKELAMVENNDQGRKARRHFIEVEKRFKEYPKVPLASTEHDKITKLLQIIRMSERESLFSVETDRALRSQVAEMITGNVTDFTPISVKTLPTEKLENAELRSQDYKGRWYTSKDIAKMAKVTAQLVSKLATEHNLRTDAYSRLQSNRTGDGSTGLTWIEYNETAKNLLVRYAAERIAKGYVPRVGENRRRRTRR